MTSKYKYRPSPRSLFVSFLVRKSWKSYSRNYNRQDAHVSNTCTSPAYTSTEYTKWDTGISKEAANVAAYNSNYNQTHPSPINSAHVASVAKSPGTTAASTLAGWPIHWRSRRGRNSSSLHPTFHFQIDISLMEMGAGNTTQSKTAANQMRRHAHQSEVSAQIVVQCCGCGIITGPNWFILLRRRLIPSCRFRMRWCVLWIRLSRLMYGGRRGRRRFTSCTAMRVWRGGTRSIIFTTSEEMIANVYIVYIWLWKRMQTQRPSMRLLPYWNIC